MASVSQSLNEYLPDTVSPPGETLADKLEEIGMSQAELSERMGRPKKTINEIVKGRAALTPETAIQLEKVLGIPASFWIAREQRYREYVARNEDRQKLLVDVHILKSLPVKAMARLGWIREYRDKVNQLSEVLTFFGVASVAQFHEYLSTVRASYRKSKVFESDGVSIATWLRKGEMEARNIRCLPYDKDKFLAAQREARKLTIESPKVFLPRLTTLFSSCGVSIVFVPELPKARVCGATRWISSERALILLSLRYKSDDQLWFTFFHECGHIMLHGKRDLFIELGSADGDEQEIEADSYAASHLIPPSDLQVFRAAGNFSKGAIKAFASKLGIAPGIVVGRLQHSRLLRFNQGNELKTFFSWGQEERPRGA